MTWPLEALTPKENAVKIFTLEALAELTQELLNDPNLKHKNIAEKAAIYGHASTVLSAQRYAVTLESMSKTMISALKAQASVDLQDVERAPGQSWVRLVSDELEALHRFALALPESERAKVIPAWTDEEMWAVRKDPPKEFQELAEMLSATLTPTKWDGCAHVLIKLEEIAKLNYENVPVWSTRRDLDELHRRLEWALQSIKAQESSQ